MDQRPLFQGQGYHGDVLSGFDDLALKNVVETVSESLDVTFEVRRGYFIGS